MTTDLESRRLEPSGATAAILWEPCAFGLVLAVLLGGFFHESLFGGKILSPADVLLVEAAFRGPHGADYEPANRLLMDPVLQFQPWLELNRSRIRQGGLPLWNPFAGCGAPHLANGQSAVFDPFHLLAYFWTVPDSLAWTAAGRLWIAGLGMFLLARWWGLREWGRWFAGLVFPFTGFLVAWLLYPVTPTAIWIPWLILTTDRTLGRPTAGAVAGVAAVAALVLFAGHVQTGAHVLLAAGLFVVWRGRSLSDRSRALLLWSSGIALGAGLAAVQILPLADYLGKSPVWSDRQRDLAPWWKPAAPRILDSACSAVPYVYGSQRRGHPNLARALGVHNLNESVGGFAGLPTLVLLAPLAWLAMRSKGGSTAESGTADRDVAPFLFGLAVAGFLGAYRLPPVDNLLRLLPVLNVTDNRRLGLWTAFSLPLLGGIGLDALRAGAALGARWLWASGLAGLVFLAASASIVALEPAFQRRAESHYRAAAERNPAADPNIYRLRANRQVRATVEFLPRYYLETGCGLLILAGLTAAARRRPGPNRWLPAAAFLLTLADLGRFGLGLNPAIDREIQSFEPPLIARLRRELKPGERVLGVGEELPPNVLMRFGLGDPRNYDSIELARSLNRTAPLFGGSGDADEAATSRRTVSWRGAAAARERLEESCTAAIVGASPPPDGLFENVEKIGGNWVVRLQAAPWAGSISGRTEVRAERADGRIVVTATADRTDLLIVRETWDDGWRARIDGTDAPIHQHQGAFLELIIPEGSHEVIFEYDPPAARRGLAASGAAAVLLLGTLALTRIRRY